MVTHVSILSHKRVCCETLGDKSNGSTINGQVHLVNADGVISRPSEALDTDEDTETFLERGCSGDEEFGLGGKDDAIGNDESDEDTDTCLETGCSGDEELVLGGKDIGEAIHTDETYHVDAEEDSSLEYHEVECLELASTKNSAISLDAENLYSL